MVDVRPDPKPVTEGGIGRKKPPRGWRTKGRKMATREEWTALRAAKLGTHCRICESGIGPREPHHLVLRSMGGDDVEDNLVGLCKGCHDEITRNDPERLAELAERLTDAEYAYCVGKLGEGALVRLFGVGRG